MVDYFYESMFVNDDTWFIVERLNNVVLELNADQKRRLQSFEENQSWAHQEFLDRMMNETRV